MQPAFRRPDAAGIRQKLWDVLFGTGVIGDGVRAEGDRTEEAWLLVLGPAESAYGL